MVESFVHVRVPDALDRELKFWEYVPVSEPAAANTPCAGKAPNVNTTTSARENAFEKAFDMFVLLKQKTQILKYWLRYKHSAGLAIANNVRTPP
jgi:hypothetical protein